MQSSHDIEVVEARGAVLHLRLEQDELKTRVNLAEQRLREAEERARRSRMVLGR
jgi:hypothetical protein